MSTRAKPASSRSSSRIRTAKKQAATKAVPVAVAKKSPAAKKAAPSKKKPPASAAATKKVVAPTSKKRAPAKKAAVTTVTGKRGLKGQAAPNASGRVGTVDPAAGLSEDAVLAEMDDEELDCMLNQIDVSKNIDK